MALMIRWTLAFPGQPFPIIGKCLFPETGGVIPSGFLCHALYHAWNHYDFLRHYPHFDRSLWQFLHTPDDRCSGHGFSPCSICSPFWFAVLSGLILVGSLFVPLGAAAGGWTSYPTLSTLIGSPGNGQTLWTMAIFILGISSTMGAINYITTIITLRAKGMGYFDMPLTIWGLGVDGGSQRHFPTRVSAPAVSSSFLIEFLEPRSFWPERPPPAVPVTRFFSNMSFGFSATPRFISSFCQLGGLSPTSSPFFARKPAFGAKATALSMTTITILSTLGLWPPHVHHSNESLADPILHDPDHDHLHSFRHISLPIGWEPFGRAPFA